MSTFALIRQGARHPLAFIDGARTFRLSVTTSYDDMDEMESHDSGRELAHRVTLRRWDDAA